MRESVHGDLNRVPYTGLWDTTQSREISTNIISLKQGCQKEKDQEFRGLSDLLIGIKEEHPGKHHQLTSLFSIGTENSHWMNVPWKYPAHSTNEQSAKIKPLKSHWLYRTWNKNQGALLQSEKHDWHSTEKQKLAKPASNTMIASFLNPIKPAGGNGKKMPKSFLSETTLCSGRLSIIIILRE